MDVAYDQITDEALAPADAEKQAATTDNARPTSLNAEFQEAFKAVSASPWGSALGGWLGEARKQGQALYTDLQKEASEAQGVASKHISGLRDELAKRTSNLSFTQQQDAATAKDGSVEGGQQGDGKTPAASTDIVKEAGALVSSLRTTAAARLKDLQRAEDAADEALLKFGSNIRDFLREAVVISGPGSSGGKGGKATGSEVLFETQEPGTGRKVFHTTRFDAQLHAIHSNTASFLHEPEGKKWDQWQKEFDVEQRTTAISTDLERYTELRAAMEKLVPEKIEYKVFWTRYYFLRSAVEEEERRRKEVLKGAAAEGDETIGWDDDDDEDEQDDEKALTPNASKSKFSESTTTLNAPANNDLLKPVSPRRSHEDESKSVAGSDASYDIVSGTTSRAAESPKDDKKAGGNESDDDWE